MNRILLFEITDVFNISQRGKILIPGPSEKHLAKFGVVLKIGTVVEIESLDGQTVVTKICGIEMCTPNYNKDCIPVMLEKTIDPVLLMKGTKVFYRQ